MADPKQQIELECQQVRADLLKLVADRGGLGRELEELTRSSQRVLREIMEDGSRASEGRLHGYEAEKGRILERLETLEGEIAEKDEEIANLDAKAGDYLLQVSTTSNSLCDEGGEGVGEGGGGGGASGEGDGGEGEDSEADGEEEESERHDKDFTDGGAAQERPSRADDATAGAGGSSESEPLVDALERRETNEVEECEEKGLVQQESDVITTEEEEESTEKDKLVDDVSVETEKRTEMAESDVLKKETEGEKETSHTPLLSDARACNEDPLPAAPLPLPTTVCASASIVNGIGEKRGTEMERPSGGESPALEQVVSLSVLVSELRRVKDDMGKCMSLKEQSFIELEDQLQAANKEVMALRASMSVLSKDLEEKDRCYHVLQEDNNKKKMDIEVKMNEIRDVTNTCTALGEEKSDLLRKLEVLEIMMTEYRTEIEDLVAEKTKMEDRAKELLSAQATAAEAAAAETEKENNFEERERDRKIEELSEKVRDMEREAKESNDKLKVTNRHLKVMAREREHKQRECDILKRKVEMVELKMCELQGTFDRLVKAVMVERDDVIKEMEEKTVQIDDLQQTLVRLKDTHEQELENVLYDKKLLEDELSKYRSGELRSTVIPLVEKKDLDAVIEMKESLETQVRLKTEEIQLLQAKVKTIQDDMDDFVTSLKEEMSRVKEECDKVTLEKASLEGTFSLMQAESLEASDRHRSLELAFQDLQQSSVEKTASLEALRLRQEELVRRLEELDAKNFGLVAETHRKEEEFKDELSAREGTIQELTVTLTNNQKQSTENYNALQRDAKALEAKYGEMVEENKRRVKEMEERLRTSEDEKCNESKELQQRISSLVEEMKERREEVRGLRTPSQASGPAISERECRERETKEAQIEALAERGNVLEGALEATRKKLEAKENEMAALLESVSVQQTITGLSEEFVDAVRASGTLNRRSEFEADLAAKEDKIRILESKVSDMEMCLSNKSGYITQLEGRLEGAMEVHNDVESHLKQISDLSSDISGLKEELRRSCGECDLLRNSIARLEKDRVRLEGEKAKLVDDYDAKLQRAIESLEETKGDLEKKKKLG